MTWTATVRDTPYKENGKWCVIIRFADGLRIIDIDYKINKLTANKLEKISREKIAELDAADLETTSIVSGTPIDLTPPAPPTPPTRAELDAEAAKKAWFQDWRKLIQLQALANSGLTVPTTRATQISDLQTSLNATWLNSYRNDI